MDSEMRLSPPWVEYMRWIQAIYGKDEQVEISFDEERCRLTLRVKDRYKADAIASLLPTQVQFGNVIMSISVVPANDNDVADAFNTAFRGNPAFGGIVNVLQNGGNITYALFKPNVVQYYNDDISSCYGYATTTLENVAKQVFKDVGDVRICSEMLENADS